MRIRQFDVSKSDKQSAETFFEALFKVYDLGPAPSALDMFARDGALTVYHYAYKVTNLDLWELNEVHRPALEGFRPREVVIGCSYATMAACRETYDLVVIDTPQGIHNDSTGTPHVEHFDVLRNIRPLLNKRAVIVLYVNKQPYDRDEKGSHGYDEYAEYSFQKWMNARTDYYQGEPTKITEERAIKRYTETLGWQGIKVNSILSVPCHSDVDGVEPYAFRLALDVSLP